MTYPPQGPYAPAYQPGPVTLAPNRPPVSAGQALKAFFQNYARFTGRANRGEYWWPRLIISGLTVILVVGGFALSAVMYPNGTREMPVPLVIGLVLALLISLVCWLPFLSSTVRRLHDANFSGWFCLLGDVATIMCALGSNPAGAQYDAPDGSQPAMGR